MLVLFVEPYSAIMSALVACLLAEDDVATSLLTLGWSATQPDRSADADVDSTPTKLPKSVSDESAWGWGSGDAAATENNATVERTAD